MSPKLSVILSHYKKFSRNIVLQMPKNTNIKNLLKIINLCYITPIIKIEKIKVNDKLSQLFIYLGDIKYSAFSIAIY
jgi:sulfopyruvate decarboxylase TPP-binding subunit